MSESRRKAAVIEFDSETFDPDIARYETMTDEEVNAELAKCGIDPGPTIQAVTALVESRVAEWKRSRPSVASNRRAR
jgi:hypothetical protein